MKPPYYEDDGITLWCGDALEVLRTLPAESVNCVVTSPPYYGLRDYGVPGQYGAEETPQLYVEAIRAVLLEVRRVLAIDGTLWLNLGDTFSVKADASAGESRRRDRVDCIPARRNTLATAARKSLMMLPERIVLGALEDGWILRNKVVWAKTNPLPESVGDRLTTSWEPVFLMARAEKYWFDVEAVLQPALGRDPRRAVATAHSYALSIGTDKAAQRFGINPGSRLDVARDERRLTDVWPMGTASFPESHFAVFPEDLVRQCVLAGCRPGGVVLDPFCGSGTTGMVALKHGRRFVGIDLSAKYLDLALRTRLAQSALVDVEEG